MSGFDKLTLNDGSYLYFKDWGSGQPVVFSHGWPIRVFGRSPTIAAAMVDRPSPGTATTWIPMLTIWLS
jgi:pimeloyl-ACP methyl ester carboxylesterase